MLEPKANHENVQQYTPIVRQGINNHREALVGLFSHHRARLYRKAFWVTGSPEDAEDALQDGLLSAYVNLSRFEGRSQFSSWLHRIVINAALIQLRRKRRLVLLSLDQQPYRNNLSSADIIPDPTPNPEEKCEREEQFQVLRQELQRLPPVYRNALWLRYFEGLSYTEAAEILGVPMGSFKAQLRRARRMLRKKITLARSGSPVFRNGQPEVKS